MKTLYPFMVGIVFLCLLSSAPLSGQVSISQDFWGNDGLLPRSNSIEIGLGTYDDRIVDWELHGQFSLVEQEVFRDEHFVSAFNQQQVRLGLRFYPFGAQDHLLWRRTIHRRGKRVVHQRHRSARNRVLARRAGFYCWIPTPLRIPGFHLGVSYGYTMQQQETIVSGQTGTYDQNMSRHSISAEVGYSLCLEWLSVGIHFMPVQYNWTAYASENPSPLVEQSVINTQGFALSPAWRLRFGFRLW